MIFLDKEKLKNQLAAFSNENCGKLDCSEKRGLTSSVVECIIEFPINQNKLFFLFQQKQKAYLYGGLNIASNTQIFMPFHHDDIILDIKSKSKLLLFRSSDFQEAFKIKCNNKALLNLIVKNDDLKEALKNIRNIHLTLTEQVKTLAPPLLTGKFLSLKRNELIYDLKQLQNYYKLFQTLASILILWDKK
jgi:hypothetical protein